MKKIIALFAVGLACVSLAISQEASTVTMEESVLESDAFLAYNLAKYGYANDSASALLQSAEIILQSSKSSTKVDSKKVAANTSTDETASYSATKLIADAKKLAGKDANLLAWAKELEKSANTSTRGYGYTGSVTQVYTCNSCGYSSTHSLGTHRCPKRNGSASSYNTYTYIW